MHKRGLVCGEYWTQIEHQKNDKKKLLDASKEMLSSGDERKL